MYRRGAIVDCHLGLLANMRARGRLFDLMPLMPLHGFDINVAAVRILGFSTAACRYIRNAPIFWDTFFLGIWTRYYGMPKSLGYVYNGMPVNAGE